jgi:hypothetical protein
MTITQIDGPTLEILSGLLFFNDGEGECQQIATFADVTVWGKSGQNFAVFRPLAHRA